MDLQNKTQDQICKSCVMISMNKNNFDHRDNACQWKIKRKKSIGKKRTKFIELSKQLRSKIILM